MRTDPPMLKSGMCNFAANRKRMRILSFILHAMPMAAIAFLISGCAGSGYLKDLNRYTRKANGPDIASSRASLPTVAGENREGVENPEADPRGPIGGSDEKTVETDAMAGEALLGIASAKPVGAGIEKAIAPTGGGAPSTMEAEEGGAKTYLGKDGKSSTGVKVKSRKSERQPPEIDWGNNSRKDWFFLIMSGLGLIVGLFGVGFGWIVFLIFGGLYLYRKIVRRK